MKVFFERDPLVNLNLFMLKFKLFSKIIFIKKVSYFSKLQENKIYIFERDFTNFKMTIPVVVPNLENSRMMGIVIGTVCGILGAGIVELKAIECTPSNGISIRYLSTTFGFLGAVLCIMGDIFESIFVTMCVGVSCGVLFVGGVAGLYYVFMVRQITL